MTLVSSLALYITFSKTVITVLIMKPTIKKTTVKTTIMIIPVMIKIRMMIIAVTVYEKNAKHSPTLIRWQEKIGPTK